VGAGLSLLGHVSERRCLRTTLGDLAAGIRRVDRRSFWQWRAQVHADPEEAKGDTRVASVPAEDEFVGSADMGLARSVDASWPIA
jgi:hypothetical protein